jgi:hypothetical protein
MGSALIDFPSRKVGWEREASNMGDNLGKLDGRGRHQIWEII